MKPPAYYKNREQTYLKHFFLERYLERVAYVIGNTNPGFVFVDGFSGPWRAADENFEDTSFKIAIQKLVSVREVLAAIKRYPKIRCVFVEKNSAAYKTLAQAVSQTTNIEAVTFKGQFEHKIPDILHYIGNSFALFFIDPTGWKGYGMKAIAPVLQHRGEVLINFMYEHINRFINEHPSEEIQAGFDELFGTKDWRNVIPDSSDFDRENTIINFYCQSLKTSGNYSYVTYTRIDHPTKERTYFYLVYGTRHIKGLQEFKKVEKQFAQEQVKVRLLAKEEKRLDKTAQPSLFASDLTDLSPLEDKRNEQLSLAETRLKAIIDSLVTGHIVPCERVFGPLLEIPLIWESDTQDLLKPYQDKRQIEIIGMPPKGRVVKVAYQIRRVF